MSDSHNTPTNQTAAEAIQDRYWELRGAHEKAQENIVRLQSHQRQLLAEIEACVAAARLFGLDLDRPPTIRACGKGQSIKALILQIAEDTYPQPVQAAQVRRQLANMGYAIHDKTVGMTLYRWAADGRMRRDGYDWYFVPHESRQTPKRNHQAPERERVLELA